MKTTQKFKFGSTADEIDDLANKVLQGEKTSTSSLLDLYSIKQKKFSKLGEYVSILDSTNQEVALIRILKMEIIKFKDIPESFAIAEGDGSLENWRTIHKKHYSNQLSGIGKELTEDTELVCEWFNLIQQNSIESE